MTEGHYALAGSPTISGWRASDTRELSFTDCRVPADHVLGERGRGYAQFLSTLDEGRVAISALAVGLAQGCVDESVRYAREREAFGRPAEPWEVANVIVFLASDYSGYMTGEVVSVSSQHP